MSKTKDGGYMLHEPDAAADPSALPEKEDVKKTGKGRKPGTVKRSGNRTARR